MIRKSLLPALAATLLVCGTALAAPERYSANGHYYEIVTQSGGWTWAGAREEAEGRTFSGMPGHMVTITSQGENDFLRYQVFSGSGTYWIGGFQKPGSREPDLDWEWCTGEPWGYTNWNTYEPNDAGGTEDGAEINASTGIWNDNTETKYRNYVIEYEPVAEVLIDGGSTGTRSTDVTLTLIFESGDDAGVPDYRLRNTGDSWTGWSSFTSTVDWTVAPGEGPKTVEVEFRDDYGLVFGNQATIWIDLTDPVGSVRIEDGAEWTYRSQVELAFTWTDVHSGVASVRVRNPGEDWSDWIFEVDRTSWDLAAGEGTRSVEVEFRDGAGNLSNVASDEIGVDLYPPQLSIAFADGGSHIPGRSVFLNLSAVDTGSGVAQMRFRRVTTDGAWEDWMPFETPWLWTVTSSDGLKRIEAQVSDRVGFLSAVAATSSTLDTTPPEVQSFRINSGRPYVLPDEEIVFEVYGADGVYGAGVDEFKASFDGGSTWSPWYSLLGGYLTTVDRPAVEGLLSVRIVCRDRVGHESAPDEETTYLVESDLLAVAGGGKLTGDLSPAADVDAFAVDLVKGDALNVKAKVKSAVKGKTLLALVDLVGPEGDRLHLGRYPADAKQVGIAGYVAPATGRYLVVLRRDPASDAEGGSHSLSVKVRQDKANKKAKGTSAGDVVFEAGEGSTLKATLKGDGLTAEQVTLTGPDGEVPFTTKAKNGTVKILPVVLAAGSGAYTIAIAGGGEVSYTIGVKLPKKVKGTIAR